MKKVKKTVRPEFHSPPLHLLILSRTYPDDIKPLVKAWTMETEESLANPTSASQEAEGVEPATESVVPSEPAPSTRIPRLAPTSVWKKTIGGLISGERKRATRSAPAIVPVDVLAPVPPSSAASLEPDSPKKIEKIDWSEDVEKSLFTPGNVAPEKTVDTTTSVSDRERVAKTPQAHVFEKCGCALQDPHFKPESWNKFKKIPDSCHPRPLTHPFSPQKHYKCNPSTRIVVDASVITPQSRTCYRRFAPPTRHKNVCYFDGLTVGAVVWRNASSASMRSKSLRLPSIYSEGVSRQLSCVDVKDRTFGRRTAVPMGPVERKAFVEFVGDLIGCWSGLGYFA